MQTRFGSYVQAYEQTTFLLAPPATSAAFLARKNELTPIKRKPFGRI